MIDFHSHILPGIDDGSRSKEQSLAMLQKLGEQGVTTIVATPHFYPDETVDSFLERRQGAYDELIGWIEAQAIDQADLPRIVLGAEVLLGAATATDPQLPQLCIQGTPYMLLEMPYGTWGTWMYQAVEEMIVRGITPIIAHVERYEPLAGLPAINQLMTRPVLGQLNTCDLVDPKTARLCRALLRKGAIHLIGSDVHRVRQLTLVDKGLLQLQARVPKAKRALLTQYSEAVLEGRAISPKKPKPIRKIIGIYMP